MKNHKLSRRQFLGMSASSAAALATMGFPLLARAQDASAFQGAAEFWDWEYAPRQAYMQQLITEWQEANPGISFNYTTFP
jgi:ABC-type glycerol-3-phosphate transport system substrate-binding protein